MKSIYECVLRTLAFDCIELGTGYGTTACVIAAALEELGKGQVTTVDLIDRDPIGVRVLADYTGLSRYINVVVTSAGYDWYLADIMSRQSNGSMCQPCFDFCFLDGAHEWGTDALATFLMAKLLRPGGWFVFDDLDFRLRGCHPGWENDFGNRSDEELDSCQVGMVFDLVARQHSEFSEFTVTDAGRTGWVRKVTERRASWQPLGRMLDANQGASWRHFSAVTIVKNSALSEGILIEKRGELVAIKATQEDPKILLPTLVYEKLPVSILALRLRLIAPAKDVIQVFWVSEWGGNFSEEHSVRVGLKAGEGCQDVYIRIAAWNSPRLIFGLRLDPTDGPGLMLLEGLAVGT